MSRICVKVEEKDGKLFITSIEGNVDKFYLTVYNPLEPNIIGIFEDGDSFIHTNQFKEWTVKKVSEGEWRFEHSTFKDKLIKSGNLYLLATSSGAARNGIMHNYKEPENILDVLMQSSKGKIKYRKARLNESDIYISGDTLLGDRSYKITRCISDGRPIEISQKDKYTICKYDNASVVIYITIQNLYDNYNITLELYTNMSIEEVCNKSNLINDTITIIKENTEGVL